MAYVFTGIFGGVASFLGTSGGGVAHILAGVLSGMACVFGAGGGGVTNILASVFGSVSSIFHVLLGRVLSHGDANRERTGEQHESELLHFLFPPGYFGLNP
jgi:hypothetical protein